MPDKGALLERRLEDDVRASLHCLDGQLHPSRETRIALGDVDYVGIAAFEPFEKRRFMGKPLVLDQTVLVTCWRFLHRGDQVLQIQRRQMLAFQKAADVRGGIQLNPVSSLHGCIPSRERPEALGTAMLPVRLRRRASNPGRTARTRPSASDSHQAGRNACPPCAPHP
ncbi:hypothetical protein D3C72_1018260 [compost metagenome]